MTNQKIGKFSVLSYAGRSKDNGDALWLCICECGRERTIRGTYLRRGKSTACRHCTRTKKNLAGKIAGNLKVLNNSKVTRSASGNTRVIWECECLLCGTIKWIGRDQLATNRQSDCGCSSVYNYGYVYFMRSLSTGLIKIGLSKTPKTRKTQLNKQLNDKLEILLLIQGGLGNEVKEQNRFNHLRAKHPNQPRGREWFLPDPELINYIETKNAY